MSEAEAPTKDELQEHEIAVQRFKELGFMETEAHLLASAGVYVWAAERLLMRGCSHALAVRILI